MIKHETLKDCTSINYSGCPPVIKGTRLEMSSSKSNCESHVSTTKVTKPPPPVDHQTQKMSPDHYAHAASCSIIFGNSRNSEEYGRNMMEDHGISLQGTFFLASIDLVPEQFVPHHLVGICVPRHSSLQAQPSLNPHAKSAPVTAKNTKYFGKDMSRPVKMKFPFKTASRLWNRTSIF